MSDPLKLSGKVRPPSSPAVHPLGLLSPEAVTAFLIGILTWDLLDWPMNPYVWLFGLVAVSLSLLTAGIQRLRSPMSS